MSAAAAILVVVMADVITNAATLADRNQVDFLDMSTLPGQGTLTKQQQNIITVAKSKYLQIYKWDLTTYI